jgi:uncharacterized protein (TIGR00266 family)
MTMQYEIIDSPDFAVVRVTLDAGEKIVSESGAMVAMDTGLDMETTMRGGLLAAAKRKLLGGESLFQNTYTSKSNGQRIFFAPPTEGDVRARQLAAGEVFFMQSGAYVAHFGEQLTLDTKWGGVKGFFSGAGLFLIKITGPGLVFYSSYGAIHEVSLNGSGYTVDTGHIVGFTEGVNYSVRSFGGLKGLFFSGEGLVADFDGTGQVYLQTRNAQSLAAFLHPFRPVKSKG